MRKSIAVLSIAAGVFAVYFVATPYITVHQMKSAAERRDGETLSEYVEFPSVRQSLKDQMNAMFAKKLTEDDELKSNPFGAFGVALAGMMVDKMVDAYVTPAGMIQLMAGEKPVAKAKKGEGSRATARKPLSDASMSYESLNKFVVRVNGSDGGEGKFVLRRHGLTWKLTDIIIPLQ